jgi:hypothetical protein
MLNFTQLFDEWSQLRQLDKPCEVVSNTTVSPDARHGRSKSVFTRPRNVFTLSREKSLEYEVRFIELSVALLAPSSHMLITRTNPDAPSLRLHSGLDGSPSKGMGRDLDKIMNMSFAFAEHGATTWHVPIVAKKRVERRIQRPVLFVRISKLITRRSLAKPIP